MEENIELLKKEFERINKLGWVKGKGKGTSNIGETFELLLGKEIENFPIADYNGIEIKTNRMKCPDQYFKLFTAVSYGEEMIEMHRLLRKYGCDDSIFEGAKKFCGSVYSTFIKNIYNHKFRLFVDTENSCLRLLVYDDSSNIIDDKTHWHLKL